MVFFRLLSEILQLKLQSLCNMVWEAVLRHVLCSGRSGKWGKTRVGCWMSCWEMTVLTAAIAVKLKIYFIVKLKRGNVFLLMFKAVLHVCVFQADLINQLYQGKLKDYVRCLECGYEGWRIDTYLDIPLVIRPYGSNQAFASVVCTIMLTNSASIHIEYIMPQWYNLLHGKYHPRYSILGCSSLCSEPASKF